MTKIYEALEKASQEHDADQGAPIVAPAAPSPAPRRLDRTMQSLCQRIESLIDASGGRLIEFTGTQPGDDSSRLLCEFAISASGRMYRRVLLVAAGPFSYINKAFHVAPSGSWEDTLTGNMPLDDILTSVNEHLSVTQVAITEGNLPRLLSSPDFPRFLEALRDRFDLILIDAPPVGRSTDAVLLSPITDGVVLVVEARRTRWQVVKSIKDQITMQKGKVLGILLNKRRFYIPAFIYRRL